MSGRPGVCFVTSRLGWSFASVTAVLHYNDVIMNAMASQITSLTIVYSSVYSGADQRKHQSSAWLAFVRGNHRWPVTSTHKGPVTRKMFPFDDVIMDYIIASYWNTSVILGIYDNTTLTCFDELGQAFMKEITEYIPIRHVTLAAMTATIIRVNYL